MFGLGRCARCGQSGPITAEYRGELTNQGPSYNQSRVYTATWAGSPEPLRIKYLGLTSTWLTLSMPTYYYGIRGGDTYVKAAINKYISILKPMTYI